MASRHRRVVRALGAQEALNEALQFNAEKSPDGARRVLHAALDLAASLETLTVTIIAFLHGACDFERWTRKQQ